MTKMQWLRPAFKEYLWGGNKLAAIFNEQRDRVSEAWVLSAHQNGRSVVCSSNAEFSPAHDQIGAGYSSAQFPILIKFIDAREKLSLYVHPADTAEQLGKTEMWIVLAANEGAQLAYGFKAEYTREYVVSALNSNTLEDLVNFVQVKAGDVVYVPAGTLHGIGAGLLILEIQQNSDTTYRVYDYGRLQDGKPRYLHIQEALQCMHIAPCAHYVFSAVSSTENVVETLVKCEKFHVYKLRLNGQITLTVDQQSFKSLVVVSGFVDIDGYQATVGASVFVPAGFGPVYIRGSAEIIISGL